MLWGKGLNTSFLSSNLKKKEFRKINITFFITNRICCTMFSFFSKILFIFREGKGGREGERHQCMVASQVPPSGDLAHNPGMCPDSDWESNHQPFGSQASTQSAELQQPGPSSKSKDILLTWLVLRSHCWSLPEPSVTWGRGKYLIYTFKRSLQWLWTEKMQGRGEGATGR